jgi:2-dehydro-3-deoxygluconokinase
MSEIITMGEILLRLSPAAGGRLTETGGFDGCYGGSEGNVAIALASMGDDCGYVSVLPDNDLGTAAVRHLHRYGVSTEHIVRKGEVLGSYFFEQGFGGLPSKVIYNRRFSEIARVGGYEDRFDFDKIFSGCRLFHISGITFALSEDCRNLCFRFLEEAKKRGIRISFDFNYRAKLWTTDEAGKVYKRIVPYVDCLFCSERDLNGFLGTDRESFFEKFSCEYLVCRERQISQNGDHSAMAAICRRRDGRNSVSTGKTGAIQVLDRVGSGDAFCAGVLHTLLKNEDDLDGALEFGLCCFVLKHFVKGDILTMSEQQVMEFAKNQNKDVNR